MHLAIVVVHYRTPELVATALAALRSQVAAGGLSAEWVVVDNGSDAVGSELLAAQGVTVLRPGRNLGYAAGLNLGVEATTGDVLLLLNADVEVLEGCLMALLAALERGAAAAGPRFYWERSRRLLLPPAERRGRVAEAVQVLAQRGGRWAAIGRRSWRRDARRHWLATEPLPSGALSGALLAVRRQAWQTVGPFDSEFRLYFEETDWLLRAARCGLQTLYVPAAEAVHLAGRSAAQEGKAAGWFEDSARRFRARHYGPRYAGALAALAALRRAPPRPERGGPEVTDGVDLRRLPVPVWVEVSPNPWGFPAAAERLVAAERVWDLPVEVRARLSPDQVLRCRAVDERGRELGSWSTVAGGER